MRWWGFARKTKRGCNTPEVVKRVEKMQRTPKGAGLFFSTRFTTSGVLHSVPLFEDEAQSPLVSEAV